MPKQPKKPKTVHEWDWSRPGLYLCEPDDIVPDVWPPATNQQSRVTCRECIKVRRKRNRE